MVFSEVRGCDTLLRRDIVGHALGTRGVAVSQEAAFSKESDGLDCHFDLGGTMVLPQLWVGRKPDIMCYRSLIARESVGEKERNSKYYKE
jgi:hypothetical protein